jgi:hypothetical protein
MFLHVISVLDARVKSVVKGNQKRLRKAKQLKNNNKLKSPLLTTLGMKLWR